MQVVENLINEGGAMPQASALLQFDSGKLFCVFMSIYSILSLFVCRGP